MKCPQQGDLRAYLDNELTHETRSIVEAHLATCQQCQLALEQIAEDARNVKLVFDESLTTSAAPAPEPAWALARVEKRLFTSQGTNQGLWPKIKEGGHKIMFSFGHRAGRMAAATVAICLCLVLLVAFEPARSAAEDFLGVFRVENFAAVSVDVDNPPPIPSPSELGTIIEPPPAKKHYVRSVDEAQEYVTSFQLKDAPEVEGLAPKRSIEVIEGSDWSFTFDGKKIEDYLAAQGISKLVVPENLDNATIKIEVAPLVAIAYNEGDINKPSTAGKQLTFVQTASPLLEVPEDIDLDLLRSQLLNSGLLPADISKQLATIEDWRNTAVIPVPSDAERHDVDINGVPGLLVSSPEDGAGVFWQRNGVIYGLAGDLSEGDVLNIARTIK